VSRRLRLALVVSGLAVLVVVIGQLLVPGRRALATHSASAAAATPMRAAAPAAASAGVPAPAGAQGPTTVVAGVGMGFRHDRGGAAAAAASFARSYGTLVALDDAGAVAAKRAMAASASADRLVAAMQARLANLRRVWPVGSLSYRVAPLAVRVRMDGADAAAADVWYVGVVAGAGLPTYEEWVTESYRLVWERDDWRIDTEADTPGPRPDPGRQSPSTAAELDARLVGFEAAP
jgi:hypothetical protein